MRRVVAVANSKLEVGRSAATVNLAAALGALGESVLVADSNALARTILCYRLEDEGEALLCRITEAEPAALTVRFSKSLDKRPLLGQKEGPQRGPVPSTRRRGG